MKNFEIDVTHMSSIYEKPTVVGYDVIAGKDDDEFLWNIATVCTRDSFTDAIQSAISDMGIKNTILTTVSLSNQSDSIDDWNIAFGLRNSNCLCVIVPAMFDMTTEYIRYLFRWARQVKEENEKFNTFMRGEMNE